LISNKNLFFWSQGRIYARAVGWKFARFSGSKAAGSRGCAWDHANDVYHSKAFSPASEGWRVHASGRRIKSDRAYIADLSYSSICSEF